MVFFFDMYVLIWWFVDSFCLFVIVCDKFEMIEDVIFVSLVFVFEIVVKYWIGKFFEVIVLLDSY